MGGLCRPGTVVLAVFAIVTAVFAILAFRKQSREVSDQASMLKVQSGQLAEQRKINAEQIGVLALQAAELNASLLERTHDAEERKRAQAARVTASFVLTPGKLWAALIRNASDLPILDVRIFFHYVAEKWQGCDLEPQILGGPMERIRILPPHEERFVAIPENVWSQMTDVSANSHVVSIEFTDAAGNRWERDPRGDLNART